MTLDVGMVLAVLAAITSVYAAWTTRKKVDVEADASIANSALSFVSAMKQEMKDLKAENATFRQKVDELEKRLDAVEKEREELYDGIRMLCHQVESLGKKPIWKPKAAGAKLAMGSEA